MEEAAEALRSALPYISGDAVTAVQTRPQLEFDEKRHIYWLGETRLPSVTQILAVINKPGLVDWKVRVGAEEAARVSRETSAFGVAVHAACEAVALGDTLLPYPMEYIQHVEAYHDWFHANVRRVIGAEMRLASFDHLYAGTADLVAELQDGSVAVIDLKTSSSVDEMFGAQLSAYVAALAETEGILADRRIVVRMPRKEPGKLDVHEFTDHVTDWRAFLAASILFHRYFKAEAFAPKSNILGRRP
jgi:hypothetical protein